MPPTVLAERVGCTGSIRWLRDNVTRVASRAPIQSIRPIGSSGRPATLPSATCGSPAGNPARGRHRQAAAGVGDHRCPFAVHHRPDYTDPQDRGSAVGLVGTLGQLGQVPRRLI
jgi:hypothetical protein